MVTIKEELELFLKNIFKEKGLPEKCGEVQLSDRPDLADYQCNGALSANMINQKPRVLAREIIDTLPKNLTDSYEITSVGPGFINIIVKDARLRQELEYLIARPNYLKPKISHKRRIILDYGGPNIAKPMHVGHLRTAIIGQGLKNLLTYVGHEVIADIHMGDWGTQMGMLIHQLQKEQPNLCYFDADYTGPYPEISPVSLQDLEEKYPLISALCKDNPQEAEKARQATMQLQKGRKGYRALWQHFVALSVKELKEDYKKLGVDFDYWFGESRYQERSEKLVQTLVHENKAIEDQGALVIEVAEETDKAPVPPLMIQKADGGFLYGTSDLATLQERAHDFKADEILYVVDYRQGLHFKQVFRAARKTDIVSEKVILKHIAYGTVNGTDRRPFKTREGGVMRLKDLMNLLIQDADKALSLTRRKEIPQEEKQEKALMIGLAALKFGDLSHDREQAYIFDIPKFTQFEGKTGPYILYAAVRIKSLLAQFSEIKKTLDDIQSSERPLCILLLQMPGVIVKAAEDHRLHILCDYLYKLCKEFSKFYAGCSIIKEENAKRQEHLKTICSIVLHHITLLCDILGIQIPDSM